MRIGLIAMSGIRVCDPELRRMGMTLPGFIDRGRAVAALPSLGLLTLAGMTPAHHEVEYLEADQLEEMDGWPAFDLVAISTFTARAFDAYRVADRYRSAESLVVIGGLHATAAPAEAAEHADAVVVGEGEPCWQRLLSDAESGRLQRFYRPGPMEFDLAEAPMPAFELLDPDRYNRVTVQTARGCPWRCSFCAASPLLTSRYKQKPIEKVLAEVDRVCQRWRRPFLELADDNSFVDKRYWKRLLPRLAARGLRWFTEADISVADDPELLGLMRRAGCEQVLVGLESPISDGLAGVELKRDWKLRRLPGYEKAVGRIQSHGIRVNGCFVVGLDGHGPDIFERVERFVRRLELYDVQVTLPTPFPGTPMHEGLRRSGRLYEERPWDRCTLFDLTFEPTPMNARQLRNGFRDLAERLYSDPLTRWRRETFRRKYLRPAARMQGLGLNEAKTDKV